VSAYDEYAGREFQKHALEQHVDALEAENRRLRNALSQLVKAEAGIHDLDAAIENAKDQLRRDA
jgi:exonuclease VII small subunit